MVCEINEPRLGFIFNSDLTDRAWEITEYMGYDSPYDMIVASIETMWAEYVRQNGR